MSFEIAVIEESKLPAIVEVKMKHKPTLAVAYENPRISQYPVEVRNTTTLNFVVWCLDMLGVNGKDGGEGHHTAVYDFVNSALTMYTYQELREAVLMYVKGDFPNLPVMQQFNAVVLGKIMNAFAEHRDIALNSYLKLKKEQQLAAEEEANKLTSEEIMNLTLEGVTNCINQYNSKKYIINGYTWVYDYFEKIGLLTPTKEEKGKAWAKAKSDLIENAKNTEKTKELYNKAVREIESKGSGLPIVKAKALLLQTYFAEQISKKGFLKAKEEIINQVKELDKTV